MIPFLAVDEIALSKLNKASFTNLWLDSPDLDTPHKTLMLSRRYQLPLAKGKSSRGGKNIAMGD
jgi:hypothetical protein